MKPITWKTIQVKLSQLEEWEKNPVKIAPHDAEQLAISMKKYRGVLPYVAAGPMVKGLYPLLDGHQRKRVEIEINKVSPDLKVDLRIPSRKLTETERAEIVVRLRKNTGIFDFDILLTEFEKSNLLNWRFQAFEFNKIGEPMDYDKEWEGMPESNHTDQTAYKKIIINFTCQEDVISFSKLLNQNINEGTISLWFPKQKTIKAGKIYEK